MNAAVSKPRPIPVPQAWIETASVLRSTVPFVTEALGVIPLLAMDSGEFPAWTDSKSITVIPSKWDEIRACTTERKLPWFPTEACARAVLLLHEAGHIVFRSKSRKGRRDHMLWVMATDYAINDFIVDVFQMPPFNYRGDKLAQLEAALAATGCYDKRFHGLSAEEIYEILKQEQGQKQPSQQPQQQQGGNQPQQPSSGGSSGEESEDSQTPSQGDGEGDSEEDQDGDEDPSSDEGGEGGSGSDGDGQEGSDIRSMFGDDFGENIPESDIPEDIQQLIENTLTNYAERHGEKLHSPKGSCSSREVEAAAKKPPIPLSTVLKRIRDTVPQHEYNYRNIGRNDMWHIRQGGRTRLPSAAPSPSDLLRELVIVIDASGSMSEEELTNANRIVTDAFKHVKSHKIRRLVFTTVVVDDQELTPQSKAPIRHTGGTCISSIIDYMDNPTKNPDPKKNGKPIKPSAIILITDAMDSESSIKRFEKWRHLQRLRTIIVKSPGANFPGVTFHVDVIE